MRCACVCNKNKEAVVASPCFVDVGRRRKKKKRGKKMKEEDEACLTRAPLSIQPMLRANCFLRTCISDRADRF